MNLDDRPAAISEAIAEHARNTADLDPEFCGCRGGGWVLSSWDSWHQCPAHPGHPHPEADYPQEPVDLCPLDGRPLTPLF